MRRNSRPVSYVGKVSVTQSGFPCIPWNSHPLLQEKEFPEESVEEASNYCRNPDSSPEGPWCFYGHGPMDRELCDVPDCGLFVLIHRFIPDISI